MAFDSRGLHCAVGTAGGLVALFDLRSPRPMLVKDHMYGAPILTLDFHEPAADAGTFQSLVGVMHARARGSS